MADTTTIISVSQNEERSRRLPAWVWPLLVSAAAWSVLLISIPPGKQDFPLGDDWAFARGAMRFAAGEGIHYSKWASMPQLGQWIWSWPFLKVLGANHFALRLSVIVLSWLGLVAFYDLLRQRKVEARMAAFAACVLAVNPYFFVSQGTYMTDVPALAFGLLALSCYSRAFNERRLTWLLGATVLAVVGGITRQTMIAVPLASAVMLLRIPALRLKPAWLLSIAAPAGICIYVSLWFARRSDVVPMPLGLDWRLLLFRPFLAVHTCGLVVLPLVLVAWRRERLARLVAAFLVLLAAAFYVYSIGAHVPNGGTFPYCYGMITLWGTYTNDLVVGNREVLLTAPWRVTLTALGCIGGAHILTALLEELRARTFPGILMWFTACQFAFILTMPGVMDRYLEVLFPGVLSLSLVAKRPSVSGSRWWPGIAAAACCGLLAVALLHDWLSWNSARWELGRRAVLSQGLKPKDIEGGFEWNGWYASAEAEPTIFQLRRDHPINLGPGLSLPFSRYVFPQVEGLYALAFSPPENSVVLDALPYKLWLPPKQKKFLFVQYKE